LIDAREKAEFTTRLMHVARDLARGGADERQQRVLARYVIMHADSAQRWTAAWRKDLEGSAITRPLAQRAKTPLRRFRQEYAKQKEVRDKLVARRVAMATGRAADLRNTAKLWQSITSRGVGLLCQRAESVCVALGESSGLGTEVDRSVTSEIAKMLADVCLDPAHVFLDATSYASGERNMLAVTPGGTTGAAVMQINDYQSHLETLHALRRAVERDDETGLLLRGALIVEVCALVEATIGSVGTSRRDQSRLSLIDTLERTRGEAAYDELLRLRDDVIPSQTRKNLHDLRDQVAAHLDVNLTLDQIKDVLLEVQVGDLFKAADKVLDWLDTIAIGHVDLGTLVIGYRRMGTLAPAPTSTLPAQYQPPSHTKFLDQPYIVMSAGGFGVATSAAVAGVVAGRAKNRRARWY
jgi:hypothetical protein